MKTTLGFEYEVKQLTLDQAELTFLDKSVPVKLCNRKIVAFCLNNADGGQRTEVEVGQLGFQDYAEIFDTCLKLNGLTPKKMGEEPAA